jgi:AraC-like DNA-binding protein
VLVVQPDGRRVDLLRPFSRFLDSINHFVDPQVALLARRLSLEVRQPDAVTPLAIEALGLEVLSVAARRFAGRGGSSRVPPWLLRVRDRLHDGVAETVTLTELAGIAGVHPGHLTRAFRRFYGSSVGAYQRDLRLDWTARQLVTNVEPLSAIAVEAGFADQSHLTRTFRRRFGCTPGEYRLAAGRTNTAAGRRGASVTADRRQW